MQNYPTLKYDWMFGLDFMEKIDKSAKNMKLQIFNLTVNGIVYMDLRNDN